VENKVPGGKKNTGPEGGKGGSIWGTMRVVGKGRTKELQKHPQRASTMIMHVQISCGQLGVGPVIRHILKK